MAALHVAVGWIAAMTGLADDGEHDLRLWNFLQAAVLILMARRQTRLGHLKGA